MPQNNKLIYAHARNIIPVVAINKCLFNELFISSFNASFCILYGIRHSIIYWLCISYDMSCQLLKVKCYNV